MAQSRVTTENTRRYAVRLVDGWGKWAVALGVKITGALFFLCTALSHTTPMFV